MILFVVFPKFCISQLFSIPLGAVVRLRANGRNNSQQCWHLQCVVARIQPISLYKRCVMSVRGPNNVGTLWRSRNKRNVGSCWLKSLTGFKLSATTCNRVCKRTQHVTSNNVGSCWSTIFASVCTQPNASFYHLLKCNFIQNLDF